jgi:alpha-guaiene 2-oxidase
MPSNLMEIIFLLCGFLLFIFLFIKTAKKSKPMKLPPGPRTLPIIGNLHQLSGPLLHHILADLAKKYGPLMHLKLGEISTMVISSPEVAKEVMNDQDVIFAYRPYTLAAKILYYNRSDIAFSPYGDYWRQLRKICTVELLSAKCVRGFRSIREAEVQNMIRSISLHKGSAANLSKMIFSLTYSITAQAAFGRKTKYQEEFVTVVEEVMKLIGGFSIADIYPSVKIVEVISGMRQKLRKTHKKIDRIMGTILNEHKEESRKSRSKEAKDLVYVLLDIQASGDFGVPLPDDNIKAVIFVSLHEFCSPEISILCSMLP